MKRDDFLLLLLILLLLAAMALTALFGGGRSRHGYGAELFPRGEGPSGAIASSHPLSTSQKPAPPTGLVM